MPAAPRVSVLMPSFEQAHFLPRALASLQAQTLSEWQAIIVDDGSQDATWRAAAPFLDDARIRYLRLPHNEGLGRALNVALDHAEAGLVAYLPSDDVIYPRHLERLAAALAEAPQAVLAYAGLRHHYNRSAPGAIPGSWFQLVQCMHRQVDMRWIERAEFESDDLERLFWSRLRLLGAFVGTGELSCEWVDHPAQRHKAMQEPLGGINLFRQRYRVRAPLRYHVCLEKGTWPQLLELYRHADGQIYSSPEMRDWFDTVCPGLSGSAPHLVLDGDLPKRDWFEANRSPLLSGVDGEVHTVVPGRPIGLHPHTVEALARQGVHLHFYGDFTHGLWRDWIAKAGALAPRHLHLHANVAQDRWVEEFSRYDAGWLHCFASRNGGGLRRADWDDLNYPARIATLAAAGLPMIQRDNAGAIVAAQTLARRLDAGLFFDEVEDLAAQLREAGRMARLRANLWRQRGLFAFDTHVPALVTFFRQVIGEGRAYCPVSKSARG